MQVKIFSYSQFNSTLPEVLQGLVRQMNIVQESFSFDFEEILGPSPEGKEDAEELFGVNDLWSHSCVEICIVECGLFDAECENLFSSHLKKQFIVSSRSFEDLFDGKDLACYIAHMLIWCCLTHLGLEEHEETRECFGDFCDNMEDILLSMKKCKICTECSSSLELSSYFPCLRNLVKFQLDLLSK